MLKCPLEDFWRGSFIHFFPRLTQGYVLFWFEKVIIINNLDFQFNSNVHVTWQYKRRYRAWWTDKLVDKLTEKLTDKSITKLPDISTSKLSENLTIKLAKDRMIWQTNLWENWASDRLPNLQTNEQVNWSTNWST